MSPDEGPREPTGSPSTGGADTDADADADADASTDVAVDADTDETPTATRLRRRLGRPDALFGVVGFAAVALVVRLVALGGRIFHWDEGRVGYWILRYHETGVYFYRPIVHGPFLPIVNDWLFAFVPVSDFTARLPVAVVGGVLPLAAWLFRERLRDVELVALAALLASNPLFVYYSRFMRNDVLVAAFSVVALGFVVRGFDTGRLRYAFPAAAALGLGFTTKENAILYVLCFVGAGALLADHRLIAARGRGESPRAVAGRWWAGIRRRLLAHGPTARASLGRVVGAGVVALFFFFGIVAFFYAPRPDLWQAIGDPTRLPGVLERATVGSAEKFLDTWGGGGHQDHPYLPYLHDLAETLVYGAPALLAFGLLGVVVDRYGIWGDGPRELVTFATYWALASLFGYPIATDIQAPWVAVHVVVPLAVPAAVGVGFVLDSAREALSARDAVGVGLAALVVLAAAGGVVAANVAYFNSTSPEDKQVLQWAQPDNALKPTMEIVGEVSAANSGTDVLFVGTRPPGSDNEVFYVRNESSLSTPPPGGPAWHDRLPLPWYLEQYGSNVTSSPPDAPLGEALADAPPVVIAKGYDRTEVAAELPAYTAFEHDFRLWNDEVVVFVETDFLRRVAPDRVPTSG
ncbi:MAG: flippase activity-associated protein Agl23 [Haloquadratum sp.]